MRETREHIEAFDYYYSLGESRSLREVAIKFGKGDATIKRWSSEFHWRERVQQRDQELGSEIIARTNEGIVGFHQMNREIASKLVQDLLDRVNEGRFRLNSVADWKRVTEIAQLAGDFTEDEDGDNLGALVAILQRSAELLMADSDVRPTKYQQTYWEGYHQ